METFIENPEFWKYHDLYSSQNTDNPIHRGYGHSNHGKTLIPFILKTPDFESVLDVGCGHNEFVKKLRSGGLSKACGVDFACPSADSCLDIVDTRAVRLFKKVYGVFDIVTAFDVLEHLRPEQVDEALANMATLSKHFAFTISFRPSTITVRNKNLHPTVWDRWKWAAKLNEFSTCHIRSVGGVEYFVGDWN